MLPVYLAGLALGALANQAGRQTLKPLAGVTIALGDEHFLSRIRLVRQ